MARMPGIPFAASPFGDKKPFVAPSPLGVVLHRTMAGYSHVKRSFAGRNAAAPQVTPHFLIAKRPGADGGVVQLVDTGYHAAHVGPSPRGKRADPHWESANLLYLGIEFESIAPPDHLPMKTRVALMNADPLTPFQIATGARVIKWLCVTHKIPAKPLPSKLRLTRETRRALPAPLRPSAEDLSELRKRRGRWNGLLSHADLAEYGHFHDDHGDAINAMDWCLLLLELLP
jgi:hypothetical protein